MCPDRAQGAWTHRGLQALGSQALSDASPLLSRLWHFPNPSRAAEGALTEMLLQAAAPPGLRGWEWHQGARGGHHNGSTVTLLPEELCRAAW